MARLCVRIIPNPNTSDPSLDVLRTQEGDVVCIVDDGHQFSFGELNCGSYRIIDVPGVPQEELIHLCDPVLDKDERMIGRRVKRLDPQALKAGIWIGKTEATKAEVESLVEVKG